MKESEENHDHTYLTYTESREQGSPPALSRRCASQGILPIRLCFASGFAEAMYLPYLTCLQVQHLLRAPRRYMTPPYIEFARWAESVYSGPAQHDPALTPPESHQYSPPSSRAPGSVAMYVCCTTYVVGTSTAVAKEDLIGCNHEIC